MANILFITPSYRASYGNSKVALITPVFPPLGIATVAGGCRERGHDVSMLDLSWVDYEFKVVEARVRELKPDIVAIGGTTPLMNQVRDISVLIKDISADIIVVAGGPHASAIPQETLRQSKLDAVFVGEADFSLADYADCGQFQDVPGVVYRDGDEIRSTGLRSPIENLDDLPMPAWDLYDISQYSKISKIAARRSPLAVAEFSRGCVFKCDFCASKVTMALGYRKKSPQRCAAEVQRLQELGFREFMLADDIFTSDPKWAVEVCDAITATKSDMTWTCSNGIRVESADERLFAAMRRAGCYRVAFGFETGNDAVLKAFGKGGKASIEQGRTAVQAARKAGIETIGFFMLGLSPDTEESMSDTIEFAKKIPVDIMKFGISIAFPGTKMFNDYVSKGLVRSYNWDDYFVYTDQDLFAHERLSYETIQLYMKRAFREAMLFNPSFLLRRFIRGIKTGEFLWDAYYAIKLFATPATTVHHEMRYYARDRWPEIDFEANPPSKAAYQTVKKSSKTAA